MRLSSPLVPFSILLISTLLISCKPGGEEVIKHYASGEVSQRHTQVDGKKEGKMTEYFKDGKLKSERMFEHDQQIGTATFYYPEGAVKERQYYDQGKLHGGDTIFYVAGRPQFVRTWNHGLQDGYSRKWDELGEVIYEARYENDVLVELKGESVHPDTLLQR